MEPMVDQAASHFSGEVVVEKVNADEQPDRVRELKVRAIPTLIALHGDREIARLTGAQSREAIIDLFGVCAGDLSRAPRGLSRTEGTIRITAAVLLVTVGLMTGPAIPLLAAGAIIGITVFPRPNWLRARE
jgi:hypothetical protein